ncbi:hypothetical protein DC28_03465 [Spirochaeta lutea]|uniref:Leucine-binding protein domain-containing protein n=2 Tax=Spirochaeta lutea TaxID=1480694 RepID=A0A098R0I4_9SPIO|nr:hypothetical protein DC28_03465 [Spirochaeta lutea]
MGIDERRGITLAVEEMNSQGGMQLAPGLRRPVNLRILDDGGTPEGARSAVSRLIQGGVDVVIGLQTSGLTAAGLEVAQENRTVMISPSATSKQFSARDDYFFRVVNSTQDEARSLARYLEANDLIPRRRIAMVVDISNAVYTLAWSEDLEYFLRELADTDTGDSVIFEQTFYNALEGSGDGADDVDYPGVLAELGDLGDYDALVIATGAIDAGFFAQIIRQQGFTGTLVGSRWAKSMDLIYTGGPAVEGMIFSEMYDPSLETPEFLDFIQRFQSRFGEDPNFSSMHSYETMLYLQAGLSTMDSRELRGHIEGPALRQALSGVRRFPGVTGPVEVDEFGDARRPQVVLRIENRAYRRID